MASKFAQWWMCELNPAKGNTDASGKKRDWVKYSTVFLISTIIILAGWTVYTMLIILKLDIEGIYQFESAYAVYHFEIANPKMPDEMMYLSVALSSQKPSIMSHTQINATVNLFPNDVWRARNNVTDTESLPFVLIFSGADCRDEIQPNFRLRDNTCAMPLSRTDIGYWNSFDNIQYQSAGDFPLLLATPDLFDGNVTRTIGQYIVVSGYESYISNSYANVAVTIAVVALVVAGADLIFRFAELSMRSKTSKQSDK